MKEKKITRDYILELIAKTKSDSKKETRAAKNELIKIFTPIISKFYDIDMQDESVCSCMFSWGEYMNTRGDIDDFVGYDEKDNTLEFYYSDCCRGEQYTEYLEIPLKWIDDDSEETFRKECKKYKLSIVKNMIADLESKIEKLEKLKNKLKELE